MKPVTPDKAVTPEPLSMRAYGRHRGTSAVAVMRAIRSGRLKACLVFDEKGKAKIADVAQADAEWDANTDLSKAPGSVKERAATRERSRLPASAVTAKAPTEKPAAAETTGDQVAPGSDEPGEAGPGLLTLARASALEKEWRAKLAELEYMQKSGELVYARVVEARMVDLFTQVRTKLLGLPSKSKAALPHLTHADVLAIDTLVRESLEDLATPGQSVANGTAA